jgi:hypothetical protein
MIALVRSGNRDRTLASLQRIATVLGERKAQLIDHDKVQGDGLRDAPAHDE